MISSTLSSFVSVALYALRVSALTRDLHIVNANISPDGFSRIGVLAEGTFPGPLLTGNKGDNFQITVVNELTDGAVDGLLQSTSIHWHGLFQHGTNWADGPSFVNQCPIARNNSFLYDFSVPNQAGTYWYHSHLGNQYCDGLRGGLIIYDPLDPLKTQYDVDDDTTIITLADWYHTPSLNDGPVGTPDSTLINGLGRYVNGPASSLAVINVNAGTRYRFRLINIACDPNYVFSIDGHTLTVIEADGISTQSLTVDAIQIYAAQRYSFVLTANQPVGNYWIRANPDHGSTGFANGLNSAILRYAGAPDEDPTTTQSISNLLLEQDLHPLITTPAPGGAAPGDVDVALNLDLAFNAAEFLFTINNVTFEPPKIPVLLQILSGTQAANLMPVGSVYPLPLNKVIEVSLPGGVIGGGHPFHLHGHVFSVVRSANSTEYDYTNPIQRDVVNIGGAGDNVTIRFTTDNPGPWFLHCHIDWHLNLGFAIVFAEDVQDTAANNPVPSDWSQLCPIYNALSPSQL